MTANETLKELVAALEERGAECDRLYTAAADRGDWTTAPYQLGGRDAYRHAAALVSGHVNRLVLDEVAEVRAWARARALEPAD